MISIIVYVATVLAVNVAFAHWPELAWLWSFGVGGVFVARDFCQRSIGHWALLPMVAGIGLSWWLADPFVALASATAFAVPLVGPDLGIFIGGSTEWKLATARTWGLLAIERAAWCHMGRVNSTRRIGVCLGAGIHSFDGSSASRFAVNVPKLDGARRQGDFRV